MLFFLQILILFFAFSYASSNQINPLEHQITKQYLTTIIKDLNFPKKTHQLLNTLENKYWHPLTNNNSQLFDLPSGYWNTANTLEAILNFVLNNPSDSYNKKLLHIVKSEFSWHSSSNLLKNKVENYSYDDLQWWGLAYLRAYDMCTAQPTLLSCLAPNSTKGKNYLDSGREIFDFVYNNSWDTEYCYGGFFWEEPARSKYKNAVTNELGLAMATKLAILLGKTEVCKCKCVGCSYFDISKKFYNWILGSKMLNKDYLFNDGLNYPITNTSACVNNGGSVWSYNQGVILGGLRWLYDLEKNEDYIALAFKIFYSAIGYLSDKSLQEQILYEQHCDTEFSNGTSCPSSTKCNCDSSQKQFKGIFIRYSQYLINGLQNFDANVAKVKNYTAENTYSVLKNNEDEPGNFGVLWQGPFVGTDSITQTSVLDLFNSFGNCFQDYIQQMKLSQKQFVGYAIILISFLVMI